MTHDITCVQAVPPGAMCNFIWEEQAGREKRTCVVICRTEKTLMFAFQTAEWQKQWAAADPHIEIRRLDVYETQLDNTDKPINRTPERPAFAFCHQFPALGRFLRLQWRVTLLKMSSNSIRRVLYESHATKYILFTSWTKGSRLFLSDSVDRGGQLNNQTMQHKAQPSVFGHNTGLQFAPDWAGSTLHSSSHPLAKEWMNERDAIVKASGKQPAHHFFQ